MPRMTSSTTAAGSMTAMAVSVPSLPKSVLTTKRKWHIKDSSRWSELAQNNIKKCREMLIAAPHANTCRFNWTRGAWSLNPWVKMLLLCYFNTTIFIHFSYIINNNLSEKSNLRNIYMNWIQPTDMSLINTLMLHTDSLARHWISFNSTRCRNTS